MSSVEKEINTKMKQIFILIQQRYQQQQQQQQQRIESAKLASQT